MITTAALSASDRIRHAFFTRLGGVSKGIYDSMNVGLGSDDARPAVLENRNRAAAEFGLTADHMALPYQIHSADAITVEEPWGRKTGPRGDAVVTDRPGVMIGVSTADCGPVLFADPDAAIIGAAHAGWGGALRGILEATIEAMTGLGADRSRIVAVLGPTISGSAYEVGPEYKQRFIDADAANGRYFAPSRRDGHAMFDLPAYIVDRLTANRIGRVENLNLCTYGAPDRFFSYRRTTHNGEPDYGRMLSAIAIT